MRLAYDIIGLEGPFAAFQVMYLLVVVGAPRESFKNTNWAKLWWRFAPGKSMDCGCSLAGQAFPSLRITVDVRAGRGHELLTCVLVLIMLLLFELDKNENL